MEQFIQIEGIAAPLMRANIDTDLLVPSKEMTGTGKDGYGEKLLAPWRYLTPSQAERQQDVLVDDPVDEMPVQRVEDPAFVLNREPFRHACILITGANFGSGSSREQAVWAVRQFGFRCVIAPSFGMIFRNNCYRNGVLPIVLPEAEIQALAQEAESGQLVLRVDLSESAIFRPNGNRIDFAIPPGERTMMLEGLDAIGLTLKMRDAIETFQRADRVTRPWIWAKEEALN